MTTPAANQYPPPPLARSQKLVRHMPPLRSHSCCADMAGEVIAVSAQPDATAIRTKRAKPVDTALAIGASCVRNARTAGWGSGTRPKAQSPGAMNGYRKSVGGTNVSLMARGLTHLNRLSTLPALSFVPEARAPPKGCWPTTAPVGLSFT